MRKLSTFVALVAVLTALTAARATHTSADAPEVLHGNPFHRVRGDAGGHKPGSSSLLTYHGGPVQTAAPQKTYAIYWGADFAYNGATTYQSLITGFFQNVAADSGKQTNVYYSDTQYYQTIGGATTPITYSQSFGGSWSDLTLPTTSSCNSTAGGALCVSDAQVQAEVSKAIAANAANGWTAGLGAEYFVFLPNGVSTCYSSSSCAFSQFCAYHSHFTASNGQTALYANMPFTGHNIGACTGANGSPNGNAAADATISVTSHESNETITDPMGNAWYDGSGNENGDKCAYNYGTAAGNTGTGDYNQTIGTGKYELQQEWSNAANAGAGACVQQGI